MVSNDPVCSLNTRFCVCCPAPTPQYVVKRLEAHTQPVMAVAWCPHDGRYFVSCSDDGAAIVWNSQLDVSRLCSSCAVGNTPRDHCLAPVNDWVYGRKPSSPTSNAPVLTFVALQAWVVRPHPLTAMWTWALAPEQAIRRPRQLMLHRGRCSCPSSRATPWRLKSCFAIVGTGTWVPRCLDAESGPRTSVVRLTTACRRARTAAPLAQGTGGGRGVEPVRAVRPA